MTTTYTAQDMAIALDAMSQSVTALHSETGSIRTDIGNMQASLASIVHLLSKEYLLEDNLSVVTINANGLRLDRLGRRFLSIFSPVPVTGIVVTVAGITGYAMTLAAGWTPINLPDGAILIGTAGTNQAIIVKASNYAQPPAAVTPVGGPIALATPAPTATNVAADTPIPFASAIQHLVLQNNATQNVYYAFDVPASLASFVLPPNAQAFFDWPLAALHVYTVTAVNINAANGLVLAGRA